MIAIVYLLCFTPHYTADIVFIQISKEEVRLRTATFFTK